MSDALIYTKAFAKALADHLRGKVPEYTERRTGSGGCDTCDFGASEYEILDIYRLEAQIQAFAEQVEKDGKLPEPVVIQTRHSTYHTNPEMPRSATKLEKKSRRNIYRNTLK